MDFEAPLSLLLGVSPPLYAPHLSTTAPWDLSPLQDQHAAGLLMWAPASAAYLVAALVILGRWIGPSPRGGAPAT